LPEKLVTAWQSRLRAPISSPVVAGRRVFVAEIDAHTLHALDSDSGRGLWSFIAGGRIDSPPTIHGERAVFGCADGYVYCLRVSDGRLAWRYRAAPEDRLIVAYGQLESAWPVHGSVLVREDVVYAVAGRSSFLDGGMSLHRIDIATGKQLSLTALNDRDPETGLEPRKIVSGTNIGAGSLPDVLAAVDGAVFMRHVRFNYDGKIERDRSRRLYVPAGFLDDTWWHRTYWMYGGSAMQGGYGGWPNAGNRAVAAGRLLAVGDDVVCGFGRTAYAVHGSHAGLSKTGYHLFAVSKDPEKAAAAEPVSVSGKGSFVRIDNTPSLNPKGKPLTVLAWIKTDKQDGVIIARGAGTHGYALAIRSGVPEFSLRIDRELASVQARSKVGAEWTHLAGVLTKSKALKVFVNGELAGESEAPGLISTEPGDCTDIGVDNGGEVGDYSSALPFTGLIDEVHVYHRALTAEEIAGHASGSESPAASDKALVLCLGFDGGKPADSSGKENHGAATGVRTVAGRKDQAFMFTGEAPPVRKIGKGRKSSRKSYLWSREAPLIARAFVLADRTLYAAGAPIPAGKKNPLELLGQGHPGILMAISTESPGETVAEYQLQSQPVFDGLAAAEGRLFMSLQNGQLVCMTGSDH
jgi:hypothetical protein